MIKFIHFNQKVHTKMAPKFKKLYQNRTIAVVPAEAAAIRSLARDFVDTHPTNQLLIYKLRIGVTFLHPKDQYSKSVGRSKATLKMEDVPVTVVGVKINQTHIFIKLETIHGVDLNLRLNKSTNYSTVIGQLEVARGYKLD